MSNTEKSTEKETPATTAAPESQQQGPDLTVQDLQALKSIIEVVSSRGAFKPAEMTAVGSVYAKLEAFLGAVAAQSK